MSPHLGIRYAQPAVGSLRLHPPVDCDGEPAGSFGDSHTLNVWSMVDSDAPVLLWVHGGANTVGSSSQPEYAGDALASLGVVFVSCNYRLAADGYGALEGFPHNRGLLDVVSALRWIQSIYAGPPAHHGADVPSMFRGDIARAWASFARNGDPGWPRSEVRRWVSSRS